MFSAARQIAKVEPFFGALYLNSIYFDVTVNYFVVLHGKLNIFKNHILLWGENEKLDIKGQVLFPFRTNITNMDE